MHNFKEDDNITLSAYAKERRLVDKPVWEWARRFTKNPKEFIRMAKIFASQTKINSNKYKYGAKVPTEHFQDLDQDNYNGGTLQQDATKNEMSQIKEFKTFKVTKRLKKAPKVYQRITVKLVFDVKFDPRRKYILLPGGHRTEDPNQDEYSGIVSMYVPSTALFLDCIYYLYILPADVGNE